MGIFQAKPLFSIVTATFNSSQTLPRLFRSLQLQSYQNFEHIVVDGNSTDNTVELARQFMRPQDTIISEADDGLYFAMNKGIQKSRGDFVCILNSDDSFKIFTLQKVYEALLANPTADIVYGGLNFMSDPELTCFISHRELDQKMIYHPTCFVRRTLFSELDYFDTRYRVAADYDFILRARNNQAVFQPIEIPLANFAEGGYSSSNRWVSILETFKIQSAHSHNSYFATKLLFVKSAARLLVDRIYKREWITKG